MSDCKSCPAFERSVFRVLEESSLEEISQKKCIVERARGESFNVQGKCADSVYCVARGTAKVMLTSPVNQQQSIVRLAAPGDLLGYRCIFSESTFRATASALEPATACRIDKDLILDLIDRNPKFARELLKRMGQEIAAAENHHHSFCKKNVRERVAEALLILKEKSGELTERGWKIHLNLTRQEMANWVGTAKETLIRCLADFREERLIEQSENHLYIINTERLEAASNNQLGQVFSATV